jgi:hypothetical protein
MARLERTTAAVPPRRSGWVRFLVMLLATCVTAAPLAGQDTANGLSPRIRVTGTHTMNIPGELTVEGNQITGTSITAIDENVIRIKTSTGGEVWTIPRSGKRLIGRALDIKGNVLELRGGSDAASMFVPLQSIATVEISEGRRPKGAILLGILAGVGVFWGTGALIISSCGIWCSNAPFVGAIVAGVVTGTALAHHIRREHWKAVPVAALPTELAKARGEPDAVRR